MADFSVAGRIYRGGKLTPGVLHIDRSTGLIEKIAKSATLSDHLDFGERAILPGGIDVHVHFREPGLTHKEDLFTGSVAAAFGGVTGFVDMPNTVPPTTTAKTLREKLALAAQKAVVDYGIWAGASWYTGELQQMLKYAVGIKLYLGATTGDLLVEEEVMPAVLQAARAAGKPVIVHAEAQRVLERMRRHEDHLADHASARPPMAEVESIYDVMKRMPDVRGVKIHIAHVSSADAVKAAELAKFSSGVCPHHLLLDTESPIEYAYAKVNPPVRSPAAREALFAAFAQGRIPILESDHAPHTKLEKEGTFHDSPSGLPGVETMIPLLLAKAQSGQVPLATVVDAATARPAALLGLADRGSLEPGLRADFAVYDLADVGGVEPSRLHSKCGWSPFAGMDAIFPSHTYLAGAAVVADGKLVAKAGSGRSLVAQPEEA